MIKVKQRFIKVKQGSIKFKQGSIKIEQGMIKMDNVKCRVKLPLLKVVYWWFLKMRSARKYVKMIWWFKAAWKKMFCYYVIIICNVKVMIEYVKIKEGSIKVK